MKGGVFLIHGDGQLIEMTEQAYDTEDLLQGLLARYPNLLAGDQIDNTVPRRWLLLAREAPLPSQEDGAGRWAVDHLFLDQDAIPTIVEVKRSNDTRIRREVVGQMLDYAANAVVYWPVETLRAQFEATCSVEGRDPSQILMGFLGPESSPEQFWQRVRTNLAAGKIRLIFAADEIPAELRRVVEFLNLQMNPAEVLAVEIRQFVGQGLKTLVPRVIGLTAEAQAKKSGAAPKGRQWDEASFLADLETRRSVDEVFIAQKILEWAREKKLRIWWGKGAKYGSFFPMVDRDGTTQWLISVWTDGRAEVQFEMMRGRPPFSDESKRLELLNRLNAIPGVSIPEDAITRRPGIPLSMFRADSSLKQFLDTLDWAIGEMKVV